MHLHDGSWENIRAAFHKSLEHLFGDQQSKNVTFELGGDQVLVPRILL